MTPTAKSAPALSAGVAVGDTISQTGERDISVHVQPDVALHHSRGANARRQVFRNLLRVVSVATGDAAAAALAALALNALAARASNFAPLVSVSHVHTGQFATAIVIALFLTGNYRRSGSGHPTLHLLAGSILGVLVESWASLWSPMLLIALIAAVLLSIGTASALFLMRGLLTAVSRLVLPLNSRLIPAVLVVQNNSVDATLDPRSGYRVAGTLVLEGRNSESKTQQLARLIRRGRAETVIVLGDIRSVLFAHLLEIGLRAGCEVLTSPSGYGVVGVRPALARRGPYNFVQVALPSLKAPQLFAKRCVDIFGALAALAIAFPLCVLIAIAIRLDSPGSVLFSQERVGIGGRRFRMIKFRTMRMGADSEKAELSHLNVTGDSRLFKIPNDPRISRIGRFLRNWSLDELPQLLNVIGGSMSLVGPRPFFERDFEDYEEHHFHRLGAKPGITGLWQVYGRSAVMDFEEVVRLDTDYIDNWSLWLDFKILFMTVPAVLRRTGAF